MAKQRELSGISDDVLMVFMERIEKSVSDIRNSVSELSKEHAALHTRVEEHIKQEVKKAILITIIMFMIGVIGGLLGYIWGKEHTNERVQTSIERPIKGVKG